LVTQLAASGAQPSARLRSPVSNQLLFWILDFGASRAAAGPFNPKPKAEI
jgi:hypothetical protein